MISTSLVSRLAMASIINLTEWHVFVEMELMRARRTYRFKPLGAPASRAVGYRDEIKQNMGCVKRNPKQSLETVSPERMRIKDKLSIMVAILQSHA